MKKNLASKLLLTLLALLAASTAFAGITVKNYVDGDVIIVLKNPDSNPDSNSTLTLASAGEISGAKIRRTFANLSRAKNQTFALIHSDNLSTQELISELQNNPDVIAASPNYKVRAAKLPNDPVIPSDSDDRLWSLKNINAPEAWEISTGSDDIYVAVIDTGIDHTHPDLSGVIATEYAYNTVDNNYDAADIQGHGTHVAGTIGARGNNNLGLVGVNWNVKIIPVRVMDSDGYGTLEDVIEGVDHVIDLLQKNPNMKLVAMNMSLEYYAYTVPSERQLKSDALWLSFKTLDDMNRTVMVVAAGNISVEVGKPVPRTINDSGYIIPKNSYVYPASFTGLKNLISVSATNQSGELTSYTNTNATISAPGGDYYGDGSLILSTWPANMYDSGRYTLDDGTTVCEMQGTSMATPHIAGAIALLQSAAEISGKTRSAYQLKMALLGGCDPNYSASSNSYAKISQGGDNFKLNLQDAIEYQEQRMSDPSNDISDTDAVSTEFAEDFDNTQYDYDYDYNIPRARHSSSGGGCNSGFGIILAGICLLARKIRK